LEYIIINNYYTKMEVSDSEQKFVYVLHCMDDLSCGMVEKGDRFGGSVKRIENYAAHKVK
jgi:hypothetical protein